MTKIETNNAESGALSVVETKLEAAIESAHLEPATAQGLLATFKPLFAKAHEICATAENLRVTDATQVTEIKQARALRLALRAIRIDAEKTRKGLKEDSLRRGKAIDGVYNVLEYAVAPVEARLLEMEEFAERAEAVRKAELKATREQLLKPFGVDVTFYRLDEMNEASFSQLLSNTKAAHQAAAEAALKAESDRIAREKAEAEERDRIRIENERLKAEAIERDRIAKAERAKAEKAAKQAEAVLKAERERLEAVAAKEREQAAKAAQEAAAKAKAEREAAEEAARNERARLQAIADSARIACEKLEAEVKARRDAEEKRQREEEEAALRAAAAPDREKLMAFAALVRTLEVPEMSTADGKRCAVRAAALVEDLANQIESLSLSLNRKAAA